MKIIERKGAEKSHLRLSLGQWVPLLEEGKIPGTIAGDAFRVGLLPSA